MKRPIAFVLAAAMVVGGQATLGGDNPPPAKQLEIRCLLFKGDPLGSRAAGTLKVQAEPIIVTLENRPAMFVSGGETPVKDGDKVSYVTFGTTVAVNPGTVKDGKIRLDVMASNTAPENHGTDHIQFHTESTRAIATIRLGEAMKLRYGKGTANSQTWIELTVDEVNSK